MPLLDWLDELSQKVRAKCTVRIAWDSHADENRLFEGLKRLVKFGVKPDHIMVYLLCGYWPGETHEDRDYRRRRLRDYRRGRIRCLTCGRRS